MPSLREIFYKKFIEPALKPLQEKVKQQEEIIKVQQEILEKRDVPLHYATPFRMAEGTTGQDIYKWKKIVDFRTLRELSERYDVARACINRRKRQVEGVDWSITPIDPRVKAEEYRNDIERVKKFLDMPGGKFSRFREFVGRLVEDLLVLDAAVVWKDKTIGGELIKLVIVDPETIRIRVNLDGSIPEPPDVAYEQWVMGEKKGEFTTDEMIYLMLNPRSNTPYGLAPLETLILGVDSALKAQLYNWSLLSEGNIPEGFFTLPESWTPDQIREFQEWFDALVAGSPRFQSRIKFMPGGKGVGFVPTKRPEDMRFLEYEKWLMLKTCALFDVPPEEIGFTEEMSRATAQVQQEVATKAGLVPILQTLKEFFDDIIQIDLGCPHLQFSWYSLDKKDELRDAQITRMLIPLGLVSVDEWRQENGLPPIGLDHFIMTGQGPVMVKDLIRPSQRMEEQKPKEPQAEKPQEQQKEPQTQEEGVVKELIQWKTRCLNAIKKGKRADRLRPFKCEFIPEDVQKLIRAQLFFAKTKEEIRKIFDTQIKAMRQEIIMQRAMSLKEDISKAIQEYADIGTGEKIE
jgi:HK97 family phage portal protein